MATLEEGGVWWFAIGLVMEARRWASSPLATGGKGGAEWGWPPGPSIWLARDPGVGPLAGRRRGEPVCGAATVAEADWSRGAAEAGVAWAGDMVVLADVGAASTLFGCCGRAGLCGGAG